MRLLRAADRPAAPWRNGGGLTREIASAPMPEGTGFLWRLSLAEIAADGPFSRFPGMDRTLTLIAGAIRLGEVALDDRSPPFRFEGEAALECRLLSPPVRPDRLEGQSFLSGGMKERRGLRQAQPERSLDAQPALALNIMTLRGLCDHRVVCIDGPAYRMIAAPEAGTTFLFACTIGIRANERKLERHDSLQLLPGDAPVALHQEQAARAVLITVRAASQCALPPV